MLTRTGRLLCFCSALWLSSPAWAQTGEPVDQDSAATQAAHAAEQERAMESSDAEARKHFEIGKLMLDQGRFDQAAQEFEAAYRLSGRPQLLYNLYIAHRDAGHIDQSIEALRSYLAQVPDAPDRPNLEARLRSLEAQRARQLDQEQRAREAAAEAERVKAEAAKERTVVEKSVVPWVLMGTGGALIAASIGTGVAALGKSKELDDNCFDENSCPRSQADNIDSTKALSLTTDVLWGVGATAAVTGFILWVTGALDEERKVTVAGLGVTPSGVSTSFTRRF